MTQQKIHIGHSPDADDAFMFYPLSTGKIHTENYSFEHCIEDIESLNQKALRKHLEITALSAHCYFLTHKHYALLPCGASVGDKYGPVVISKHALNKKALGACRIGVPGKLTTAYLVLELYLGQKIQSIPMPFHTIMDAVMNEEVDAGLIIHEGQVLYQEQGFHKVIDLGEWWHDQTGLPLVLGVNAIRRDLGDEHIHALATLLRTSIQYSLHHEQKALEHSMQYAGNMTQENARKFIHMYVNEYTLDLGSKGLHSIQVLLDKAYEHKLVSNTFQVRCY